MAKEFKVSTDYILGLSTVSVRKSYDISELGLSEGAVRGLVTGAVDVQILNRLLEHRNFPKLIDLIRIYFQDTAAKGITARNQLIEIATASLSDLMKEHPEHRAEAKQDLQLLNAQKMGEHEAEIEKIKNVFLAILRDIKKDIDNGEQPGEAVTAAMFQAMRDALAEQKQNPLSIDDVAAMVAGQIGQLTPMDEETADLFQQCPASEYPHEGHTGRTQLSLRSGQLSIPHRHRPSDGSGYRPLRMLAPRDLSEVWRL